MDDTEKLIAALSYILWPVALVMLIIQESKDGKHQNKLQRHHAYNALGYAVAVLILSIPIMVLAWVPFLGYMVWSLYWIAILVCAVIFALRAYRGEEVVVPVVTDLLKKNVKGF